MEFALAWYLTIETGSATVLATAMLIAFIPQILLGPIAGPYIDRWNRKRIMILADVFIALVTVGLVALFYFKAIQIWHIYVAMILRAIGQTIHFPAMQAAIPMIVPEKHLARASGLTQMLMGVINIAGPPAGAFLLGFLPMQGVLAIDIVTALIAIGCLLPIIIPQPERIVTAVKASMVKEMMEGFRYIWNWRGLTMLIGLSAILMFFLIPAFTLLPLMVTNYLEGDVLKLGWLESAFGVGMIAGGIILGAWGGFQRKIITSIAGAIMAGIATLALGFTSMSLFMLGVTGSFLVGVGLSFGNGPITAALQAIVAKDMQGRIFSLMGSVGGIMTPLGLAIAGPLADSIGIRPLYWIAGGAVLAVGIASFFIPSLMNLEKKTADGQDIQAEAVSEQAAEK